MTKSDTTDQARLAKSIIEKFGNLEAVKAAAKISSAEDTDPEKEQTLKITRIEEELAKQRLLNEGIKQDHKDQQANREMRFKYSRWVFYYLVGYSLVVALILFLAGFGLCGFELDADVLKFLVGSTAAAAIGLVAAVTTGLFNKR